MDFRKELYEMRERYNSSPLRYEPLPRPKWLTDKDKLSALYSDRSVLYQHGTVYYGCIVQANVALFGAQTVFPENDLPADVIYSTHEAAQSDPLLLKNFARMLYSYKTYEGGYVPQQLKEVADGLRDEYSRSSFDITPFEELGNSLPLSFRSIMVFRKHLPTRKLSCPIFPVLAAPDHCGSIIILPKKYWTKAFTKAWKANAIYTTAAITRSVL